MHCSANQLVAVPLSLAALPYLKEFWCVVAAPAGRGGRSGEGRGVAAGGMLPDRMFLLTSALFSQPELSATAAPN